MSSHVAAKDPVEIYLTGLSRALYGPRRRKADLLAEARDSLVDATEAYEADGLPAREAAERAVQDFGDLAEIVPGYRAELGIAQGRRAAVLLTLVMLAQPIVWREGVWSWNQSPDSGSAAIHFLNDLVKTVGMLSIAGAVLAVIASGIGMRYPSVRERWTRVTAQFTLLSCASVTLIGFAMAAGSSIADGNGLSGLFAFAAFVAVPLLLVGRAAHRTLRLA